MPAQSSGGTHYPWPASLWAETAAPYVPEPAPNGEIAADVAIIGGGYTGLGAAHRFLERGVAPAVLEASGIGWGASGRNGGVVSPKFRRAIPEIAARYGEDVARRMAAIGHEAVHAVEHLVAAYGIEDAGFTMTGNLRCAHTRAAFEALRAEAEIMRSRFGDGSNSILDREALIEETGSYDFVGGVLAGHAGHIHPLNYVRGLAAGLRRAGVLVHENAPVVRIGRRGDRLILETPTAIVSAGRVVIATNGYSGLAPGTRAVRKALIPFRSAMIATEPLPVALRDTLLRYRRSYSETRRMMRWFRPFGDRVIFGGRGAFGTTDSMGAFQALERAMRRVFPDLEGVSITHRWSGLVAMTMDAVPQIGRLDAQRTFALGYNGAGIAMATLVGQHAADVSLGETPDLALLGPRPLKRIPVYGLRGPAIRAVAGWYQILDALGK